MTTTTDPRTYQEPFFKLIDNHKLVNITDKFLDYAKYHISEELNETPLTPEYIEDQNPSSRRWVFTVNNPFPKDSDDVATIRKIVYDLMLIKSFIKPSIG